MTAPKDETLSAQPVSLYSILGRYVDYKTGDPWANSEFTFNAQELGLLKRKRFSPLSVEKWAACLLEAKSLEAASIFEPNQEKPPLFLLSLFLRRKRMTSFAFGVVARHLDQRIKTDPLTWEEMKILCVRLLRHARELWPESITWIAQIFSTQASMLIEKQGGTKNLTPQMLSDITHFSNTFLLLLSLPTTWHPILGAAYQEKAQFHVLQFMANHTPAITVTRLGFRSVTRNQLAHGKTSQESEWAQLKGPSWPPWKESRTAMDEDKGYEFGASRASKILHRMYEAGYQGNAWEEMAEIYAGWDTDCSPTIQTRTSLPHFSSQYRHHVYLKNLVWAGRVRATRTRREAWACFLACELQIKSPSQEVYLAMFEKLYYPETKRPVQAEVQSNLDETFRLDDGPMDVESGLLPGDMKEVAPDPASPLHEVYLSEPTPTFKSLCHRLHTQHVRPSNRLLAFLVATAPNFETALDLLVSARSDFDGGVARLLDGVRDEESIRSVPSYFITAFIKSLCKHGHFHPHQLDRPALLPPESHVQQLNQNRHYLMCYAQTLLLLCKPRHRPAWIAFMEKLVQSNVNLGVQQTHDEDNDRGMIQYRVMCRLLETMEQIDLDIDDEMFKLVCIATITACQSSNQAGATIEDARFLLITGSPRLRKLFYSLVGANMDMQQDRSTTSTQIPPHIPGPAQLHIYVRALGALRDYEGLYSFSTWLTHHHAEVTARADAQRSGPKMLHRTLVALRAVLTGYVDFGDERHGGAPEEIVQLVKRQIESVEEWNGWPTQEWVDLYVKGGMKSSSTPVASGH